jgi:predicted patatin/cPLA2 family phospholipase
MEQAGEIFVIRPSGTLTIGRLERDTEEIQKVYNIGKRDAEARIPAMLQWLSQNTMT